MIGLDRLIEMPEIIAAAQFDEKGKISRSVGDLSEEINSFFAKTARENEELFSSQMEMFEGKIDCSWKPYKDCSWKPYNGWAVWGGNYSLCVVGRTMVIVESSKTDFNSLMINLIGEEPTGPSQMNY